MKHEVPTLFYYPKKNEGELNMYFIKNDHEAIVSREIFEKVQERKAKKIRLDIIVSSIKYIESALTFGTIIWYNFFKKSSSVTLFLALYHVLKWYYII